MKITKTTTKTYEIYDCAKWSMTIGDTILKREEIGLKTKGFDKCFSCGHKFKYDDIPYLGLIRGHANMFICETCAEKLAKENENDGE